MVIGDATIYEGDCLDVLPQLPEKSINCCVTSPPYWGLRDYGVEGQLGLEETPDEYVSKMVDVFREVRRVLHDDGTLWLNLGDCFNAYNGGAGPGSTISNTQTDQRPHLPSGYGLRCKSLKPKDLIGIPWRVAFALQADGWYLRSDIIWHKPNPMPESIKDRPTRSHEYIFLLSKSRQYYYDHKAIQEPARHDAKGKVPSGWDTGPGSHHKKRGRYTSGNKERSENQQPGGRSSFSATVPWEGLTRNKRSVWTIPSQPFSGAHFATFPPNLIKPCILAGCPAAGTVLDPFGGAGTTAVAALQYDRLATLCELNPEYITIAKERIDAISRQGRLALFD